ncbi:hypothetical protein ACHAP5_003502 [Fusarium lateritium]
MQARIAVNSTNLPVNRNTSHEGDGCSRSEIAHAFDPRSHYSTWRKLWLYLAQSQKEMGVTVITDEAIEQMKVHLFITDGELEEAEEEDNGDVKQMIMTQSFLFSRALGRVAASQINYAAPFEFVSRNTHVILVRQAFDLLIPKLLEVMYRLRELALSERSRLATFRPCRQQTQISTLGRRATAWALDLGEDLIKLEIIRDDILLCGTQSTQAEMMNLAQSLGGRVGSCEELDALLCKKAGLKGCYDAQRHPTERYERDLDLAAGSALADMALGISRTLTEMGFLRIRQRDSKTPGMMITDMINRANADALATATMWTTRLGDGPAVLPQALQAVLTNVDSLIGRFGYLITEIDPSMIEPLVSEELPGIVTRKIIERMVAGGEPREMVLYNLAHLSCQTLWEQENSGSTLGFFNKIRATVYFKPVWGEIDEMTRSELDTRESDNTVDAVCGPGGSLDKLFEWYEASVEKVKSYQTPDKGKGKFVASDSPESDSDDRGPSVAAVGWRVQGLNTMVTSDYQSDSSEPRGPFGNHGFKQWR